MDVLGFFFENSLTTWLRNLEVYVAELDAIGVGNNPTGLLGFDAPTVLVEVSIDENSLVFYLTEWLCVDAHKTVLISLQKTTVGAKSKDSQ